MTVPNKRLTMNVCNLKDHPQQESVFGSTSDAELRALAQDIEKNGQRQRVHILPDGTIIAGHKRVRALRLLGQTQVNVLVRNDLQKQGPAAIEEHFLGDNLLRQHLSPLKRARCIQRLMEIEQGCRPGALGSMGKEKLKAELAARLQTSHRTVNRYLLVMKSPVAVQEAFDRNEISLIDAGKVALLPDREQNEIAQRIEAGEKAKTVIAEYLARQRPGSASTVDSAFVRLFRALKREMPKIAGRVYEIDPDRLPRCRSALQEAVSLLQKIIRSNRG